MAASKTNGMSWSHKETVKLIEESEEYPCLYNTCIKEYKDRDKKKTALEAIAAVIGPDITGENRNQLFMGSYEECTTVRENSTTTCMLLADLLTYYRKCA